MYKIPVTAHTDFITTSGQIIKKGTPGHMVENDQNPNLAFLFFQGCSNFFLVKPSWVPAQPEDTAPIKLGDVVPSNGQI